MAAESPSWNGQQLAVYLIAFVLAIGPFFNGMFFEPIRLVGVALACVAYWLWYTGKREADFAWNGVDWSVLAWFLSYVIASFTAVLPRGHLSVILDMIAFLAVYTVVRHSGQLEQAFRRILVGAGLVMMTLAVARLCGVTWLDRTVVDLVIDGRLSGGFQYANTFAVWLCSLVLVALSDAHKRRIGSLFLSIGGLFAGTFMLTLSRGALIAVPAAYVVVVLLRSREERLFTVWVGLLTWGPAFVLGSAAFRAFQQQQNAMGLAALAMCALPPLAAPYLARFTELLWSRKRSWGIVASAVVLVGALSVAPKVIGTVLPAFHKITDNRLTTGYDLMDLSIFPRLVYDSDALRIVSARHFLGAGGRGWSKLYFQVQSHPYFSTEVHNHFLQTAVEAGLIGLIAFTAILVLCLITAWRSRKQWQGDSSLAVWAGVVTYIGMHSAFDFDLSYISLLLLLAVGAGVISSHNTVERGSGRRWFPLWSHTVAGATVLALIAAGALYVSRWALLASDQAWARGDVRGTIAKVQLARRTDPLSAEPWLRMAMLKSVAGPAAADLPDAKALLAKGQALDPLEPSVALDLAAIAVEEKRWTQAIDLAVKADSLMPMNQELTDAVASVMWTAASSAAGVENKEAVHTLAAHLKDYEAVLNRRFERAAPYTRYAKAPLGYTGITHLRIGQGLILTADYEAAANHLREAAKSQSEKTEATQWLFVALDLGGNQQEAGKLREANPEVFTQFLQSDLYHKVVAAAQAK